MDNESQQQQQPKKKLQLRKEKEVKFNPDTQQSQTQVQVQKQYLQETQQQQQQQQSIQYTQFPNGFVQNIQSYLDSQQYHQQQTTIPQIYYQGFPQQPQYAYGQYVVAQPPPIEQQKQQQQQQQQPPIKKKLQLAKKNKDTTFVPETSDSVVNQEKQEEPQLPEQQQQTPLITIEQETTPQITQSDQPSARAQQVSEVIAPSVQQQQIVEESKSLDAPAAIEKSIAPQTTSVSAAPIVAEVPPKAEVHEQKSAKPIAITPRLISYFLDKDIQYEIEDDGYLGLNSGIIRFLNRQYEMAGNFNRSNNKNNTYTGNSNRSYNNNNNKQQNTFPTANGEFSRNENRKQTTPALQKQQSNVKNTGGNNFQEGGIKRQEEDKEITQFKMELKKNQGVFIAQMQSNKQDKFKKQISDIRLNLNILTPTNFEKIKSFLFEVSVTEEILCEYLVEGIIEKARTQKTYSQMYADLCKYIINESNVKFADKVIDSENNEIENPKKKLFKNHLYNNIQSTFEGEKDVYNNKMTFAKSKTLAELTTENEKMMYFMDKKKREMLNVQFIGNLFLNKSMSLTILNFCCNFLINKFFSGLCQISEEQRDSNEVEEAHYEDHIEALIALLEQTGPTMEAKFKADKKKSDNTITVNKFIQEIQSNKTLKDDAAKREEHLKTCESFNFNDYFTILEWLKKEKKISPRIYSLIINLLERKDDAWKIRLSTETGPLSVQEFNKQQQEEIIKQQKELAQYEQDQKSNNYNSKNSKNQFNNKPNNNTKYEEKSRSYANKSNGKTPTNKNDSANNSKLSPETVQKRVQEVWGYLKSDEKAGEAYSVELAIADLKKVSEETTANTFIDQLLKTIYDCNVNQKSKRLAVAYQATELVKPAEFLEAFNNRLNQSKGENEDFPLIYQFLSSVFFNSYKQGFVQFSALKIQYKPDFDEDQKFDQMFVFKEFFEDVIDLVKQDPEKTYEVAKFIDEQVAPVLQSEDEQFARWSAQMKR